MRSFRTIACTLIAALAAGCGSNGQMPVASPATTTALAPTPSPARVRIAIRIPRVPARAHYISPATKSMTIAFVPVGSGKAFKQTIDLTPKSRDCTAVGGSTKCEVTFMLGAGRYTASVSTFDAVSGRGAVLSSQRELKLTVESGMLNTFALTLYGIPHAITIAGLAPAVHGSQSLGFTLFGNTTQEFSAIATDADGYQIVGPGAPTFAVSIASGSGWTAGSAANTLHVTPPTTNGAAATIHVAATYAHGTCGGTGAVCTATVTMLHHVQNVWVLNHGSSTIAEYAYPYTGAAPLVTITDSGGNIGGTNQNAQGFAMDAQGDIFVANCSATCGQVPPDSVTEYAAPTSSTGTATHTITNGIANPEALAVDASGNLFVANQNGSVVEYQQPYTSAPVTTITNGIQVPVGLTLDAKGNLYVLDCAVSCNTGTNANTILKYASPYAGAPVTIGSTGDPAPGALLVDSSGNAFAGNAGAVTEYPAGVATATQMSVSGEAGAIALDASGDLFAAGCATGCALSSAPDTLLEFAPPYTGAAKTIDSSGGSTSFGQATALAIDGAGNLIVANGYDNTLHVYAWPYTSAPVTSTGPIDGPVGVLLTP